MHWLNNKMNRESGRISQLGSWPHFFPSSLCSPSLQPSTPRLRRPGRHTGGAGETASILATWARPAGRPTREYDTWN